MASQAEIIQQIYSVLRDYSGKFTVGDLVKFILSRVSPNGVLAIPLARFCLHGSTPEVSLQRLRFAGHLFSSEPSGAG
jgi:hypothetical protein